ncbi:hypothetical protein FHS69_002402 [Erythrobacter flavus]|nr:hypothetical protein [Qipengyuania flava]
MLPNSVTKDSICPTFGHLGIGWQRRARFRRWHGDDVTNFLPPEEASWFKLTHFAVVRLTALIDKTPELLSVGCKEEAYDFEREFMLGI